MKKLFILLILLLFTSCIREEHYSNSNLNSLNSYSKTNLNPNNYTTDFPFAKDNPFKIINFTDGFINANNNEYNRIKYFDGDIVYDGIEIKRLSDPEFSYELTGDVYNLYHINQWIYYEASNGLFRFNINNKNIEAAILG